MKFSAKDVVGPVRRLMATAQNGLEVIRFGGLAHGVESSPFEVVERKRMYRLRHYFPDDAAPGRPVALLVPPLMVNADIWDVNAEGGAVGILHRGGIDCWVVDFGSPALEEGGWERDLADHVLAVSSAIDTVCAETGAEVHLMGYSQGGMFAYQTTAYRHGKGVASIVTFGSPVDIVNGVPFGLPYGLVSEFADFLADHVVTRLPITDSMVRVGFQLLDPVKTAKARIDFLRQLHDREALLPKERQRRFLNSEGWVGYAGPAVADLLKQFVAHNRMMLGGFVIRDQPISLAELKCPILAFVGEVDDIGQPAAVRGIVRAAPNAEVYESTLYAGHFGLVAGSVATNQTWPLVQRWIEWMDGDQPLPEEICPMSEHTASNAPRSAATRIVNSAAALAEAGAGMGKALEGLAGSALRGSFELAGEAARALPRLTRLGMIQPNTRISLGLLLAEQARRAPLRELFLFDDRVHTNAAVDVRIDNVVRGLISVGIRPATRVGVVMETRPSALVAVAALSRLGAVAVLLAPGGELGRAMELTKTDTVIADPENLRHAASTGARVLVLGGGESRGLDIPASAEVIDLEQIDPAHVRLPAWYQPDPGLARELAFVLVTGTGDKLEIKYVTNHRWALSAFGTATSADLDRRDTVYCLAPLHHSSGLLVSLGGAVAGGSRIALARSLDPRRFAEEVHRYGVTVVTYTWTMLRDILDAEVFPAGHSHPIRLFIGSGMPAGLWRRTTEQFEPARVLEFYASIEGDVVLANVKGVKAGCKGRPVPGTARVELVAYDPVAGRIRTDDNGFARRCADNEVGLLIGKASEGVDLSAGGLRGVFAPGDAWMPTENLFRRDSDGDYWLVDRKDTVIKTPRGPVFGQPIVDVLNDIAAVDMEVAYGLDLGDHCLAVAAVCVRRGFQLEPKDVTEAMRALDPNQRPDLVYVVDEIPRSASYRPSTSAVRAAGRPRPGPDTWWYHRETESYEVLTEAEARALFGE
ncbi:MULTISPECIES: acyl-CoA synthetase [Nocardia]|uniref:acyl-CoA synthetase n=1 Tax=Nocardia TaxID=1817 RepID=UPI000BF22336|nr:MULTISPECIES: acyl-CoA synthetase [Nocardia]MBF6188024.1 acyl-CoA synthetase [Nocardia farcinica]MBF6314507.1 acyl-CoA synthetase [Nocardia farcinica]MBF6409910.1 acyl-CoA synthetase [Nocardia farcinica]PEH75093.1 acyl-CoA synthetase [Nocardia sp. FDAARGOS_372]UEX24632.1 acyl-CoA synthetase [Nocardia farcinica]